MAQSARLGHQIGPKQSVDERFSLGPSFSTRANRSERPTLVQARSPFRPGNACSAHAHPDHPLHQRTLPGPQLRIQGGDVPLLLHRFHGLRGPLDGVPSRHDTRRSRLQSSPRSLCHSLRRGCRVRVWFAVSRSIRPWRNSASRPRRRLHPRRLHARWRYGHRRWKSPSARRSSADSSSTGHYPSPYCSAASCSQRSTSAPPHSFR
jgi:hypothetical protein